MSRTLWPARSKKLKRGNDLVSDRDDDVKVIARGTIQLIPVLGLRNVLASWVLLGLTNNNICHFDPFRDLMVPKDREVMPCFPSECLYQRAIRAAYRWYKDYRGRSSLAMASSKAKKLLQKVGPTVTCDLCPSFTLIIDEDDRVDVRLIQAEEDREWYFADEELREAFQSKFVNAVEKLPLIDELTSKDIEEFKTVVARLLIQEVKDESLFRAEPGLGEDDDETDEEGDGGEEHA
jgi:hypothetical protein